MNDKSWMLNPKAIRYAKECIQLVKAELGVRLKLSHPEFVRLLHDYVELTGSKELGEAYARLISMAGVGFVVKSLGSRTETNVVNIPVKKAAGDDVNSTVEHSGKHYSKYREGLQFQGVYRGQPVYS